jgi:hypothetical protein
MKKMKSEDLLEEVEWQLSFGMHPIFISEQLEKTPAAIYKAAWRAGNVRITSTFSSVEQSQRARKKASS